MKLAFNLFGSSGGLPRGVRLFASGLLVLAALACDAVAGQADYSRLSVAAAGVGLPPAGHDFTQIAAGQDFVPDHLLVRFASGVESAQRSQILANLGGSQIAREYAMVPGLCLVTLPAGQTVPQALASYNGVSGILYAEPDYLYSISATFPNDARFGELWGMHNTGQTGGTPGADIHATEAWDLTTGNRQVVVAVIDTGVDYTHPDLTNNIWINLGETPGNGIDDDGNGYVDDYFGYDFYNKDADPADDHGHGTHCSGTIGGEGNNSIGVAGVCWQVRVMAIKCFSAGGTGGTADEISSIQYATLMGAQVISASWGGYGYSQALKDVIDAAGAANIVFVAAAGNSATDDDVIPFYPVCYTSPNIVAVMSTDHNDVRSSFSCYGLTSVDLAAPGSDILSCAPTNGYQLMSGTSMATPHVSGACALLLSANPARRVADIKQALLATVDPVVPGRCVSGGRLNVYRALNYLLSQSPLVLYTNYLTGGNGNGVIDFNECNTLSLVLTNVGTTNITGIRATLTTTNAGVIIAQPVSTYADIPVGGSAENQVPFKISTFPSFVCGTPIDFTLVAKSDQTVATNTFRMLTGMQGTPLRFDNATPLPIPDGSETYSTIVVSNVNSALSKVTVGLYITHPYDMDLLLQLISPDGTTNTLSASNGGYGQNYGGGCSPDSSRTVFDDDASLPISVGSPPFIGSYQPQTPLSVFIGKAGTNVNGIWRLRLMDQYPMDAGTLQCWSLFLSPAQCKDGGGECPGSDLTLRMTALPDPVLVGGALTYSIVVTNQGPSTARNVTVTHLLPSSVIFSTASCSQGSWSQAGGLVTCYLGTIAAGGQATISVAGNPTTAGAISSTASVTSSEADPNPSDNSATVVTQVIPPTADLAVGLQAVPNPVVINGTLTCTVSVTNNGPSDGSGIVVTNALPAGLAVISATVSQGSITTGGGLWTVGNLPAGSHATATLVAIAAVEGSLTCTSSAQGNQFDSNPANNSAALAVIVGPSADLAISIADYPDPVVVLSNLTYDVVVSNRGPSAATSVTVSDYLPANISLLSTNVSQGVIARAGNTLEWSVGALASGAKATLTLVAGTTTNGVLSMAATVVSAQPDPNSANNTATATTTVAPPGVGIVAAGATLTAESFTPANGAIDIGETVTVILRLRNSSNVNTLNLVGTLLATDGVAPLAPTNQTYGVLAPSGFPVGRSFTFTASGTNGQTISPTLQLRDGTNFYPAVSFNFTLPSAQTFATNEAIDIPDPAYSMQPGPGKPYPSIITVSNLSGVLGKVTVTLSNLNHSYSGDVNALLMGPTGAKTLLMSHVGNQIVTNVNLTFDDSAASPLDLLGEVFSGTWQPTAYGSAPSFPTNAPAAPYSAALSAFNGSDPNGVWSLYLLDDAGGDDGKLLDGWSLALSTITPVNQLADLGLSVAAAPNPVAAGSALTYVFTIANSGPGLATSAAFTNTLPAGVTLLSATSSQGFVITNASAVVVSLGTLSSGATARVTNVVVPLPSVIPAGFNSTILSNTATVGSIETDPAPGNNILVALTTVKRPVVDVGVGLTAAPEPAIAGVVLTNTIVVTNFGPDVALGVTLTDPLPAGTAFVSATSTLGTCSNSGGVVTCSLGDLPANAGATVSIIFTPSLLGLMTNTVSVVTISQDTNAVNSTATYVATVTGPASKIINAGAVLTSESGPINGLIDANETVTLALSLANVGTLDTVNLKATLLASAQITPLSGPKYYGVLVGGGPSAPQSFTFKTAAGLSGTVVATLQLQDERAGVTNNLGTVAFPFDPPSVSVRSNPAAIIIPDRGKATPYPSTITVSNLLGVVTKATVTLRGLTHSFPQDLSALLVSPTGGSVLLMSHAGGGHSVSNLTLTFDDAGASLPSSGSLSNKTYKPGHYAASVVFPAPAPSGAYGSTLAAVIGQSPIGVWSLYLLDDAAGDGGIVSGGWSLNLTTAVTLSPLADLAIRLSSAPSSLYVGSALTNTVWVTNLGPATATEVLVTNTLSSGQQAIVNLGSLAAGAAAKTIMVLKPSAGGNITGTASVGGKQADLNLANNSAQTVTAVIVPVPAVLSGSYVSNHFQLVVTAEPGLVYVIQASSNLTSWVSLSTNTASTGGVIKYTDPSSPSPSRRFYRTVWVAP